MTLPTLYKRTRTGAIQYYKVSVQDIDSELRPRAVIRKESGQLGTTNPIVHEETISEGKNIGRINETTYLQQANLQAASDWRRKKDEGYKSLEDLGIEPRGGTLVKYDETIIDLSTALNAALPQFDTDANGECKPMLALDWRKVKSISYPVYVQPKLDGVRCLMIIRTQMDGELAHHKVTLLSRNGKEYTTLRHLKVDVACWLVEQPKEDRTLILDGELFSESLTFQQITAAVKKEREDTLKIHFRAYDIVMDAPWKERMEAARQLVQTINSASISYVPTLIAENEATVKELHDAWVKQGLEGAMIRLSEGKYEQGQRSRSLLKVKEFQEEEFEFKNFEFGQRGAEDLIAVCFLADGKREFRAKLEGSRADKQELYERLDLEGKSMTVRFFGYTDEGSIRFPVAKGFRHDHE